MIRATLGELSPQTLRQTYARFPSGVTAVCAHVDGVPVGMTASSFTSVSLDPPLVSVCIASESSTWQRLRDVGRIGVSVLGAGHHEAARQLAARDVDRFAGLSLESDDAGAVFIVGSTAWLDCSIETEVSAGDHLIAVLRIHGLTSHDDVDPLVFYGSEFRQLAQR